MRPDVYAQQIYVEYMRGCERMSGCCERMVVAHTPRQPG